MVVITESWFGEYDQEFRVENYEPIGRADRPTDNHKKRGGGVLVQAKKDIEITGKLELSLHRGLQIVKFVMDRITVFGIYRTGKQNITHNLLTDWLDSEINKLNKKPYLITGDLNLPDLAKVNFDPKLKAVGTDNQKSTPDHKWAELVKKHRMEQLVSKHTCRPTAKSKGTILDYVFLPEHVSVPYLEVDKNSVDTNFDHFAVVFEVDSYYQRTKEEIYRRKESTATWQKFNELLQKTDFMTHLQTLQEKLKGQELVDKMLTYIVQTLREIYKESTPIAKTKPPPIGGFLTKATLRHLAHARRLYRTLVRSENDEMKPHIQEKLKLLNKSNRFLIRKDRIAWEFRRLHLNKERGDDFFRFMNEITRKTKTIGHIISKNGSLKTADKEMAEAFNDYLCDLMEPSSNTHVYWDTDHEPKEKQLLLVDIPGSDTKQPMENDKVRKHIFDIHKELAPHGYEITIEDITDCYPLCTQVRGKKSIPLVITKKDEKTRRDVKMAAMKASTWNRRIPQKTEEPGTGVTAWMKRLARRMGVAIETMLTGRSEENKTLGYFTAPYDTMRMVQMTTGEIKDAIRRTKRTSAPGPDSLRMAVYAEACGNILRPLQALYNAINTSSSIPSNFKIARVILLHMKNSKQEMGNYRPISMANHISKIWKRVLNARLMIHLNKHNMLTRHQHGFRPKRGCHTNLLEAQDKIVKKKLMTTEHQ